MPNYRKLTQFEINVATSVFQQTINYSNVYIADTFLPFNDGVPVTLMHDQKTPVGGVHVRYWFSIYWGITVYQNGADKGFDAFGRNLSSTLIHELTHVWQGQHGVPYMYMIQSMVAQGKAIIQYRNRNKAYEYDHNNYQKWKDYNVEQQAYIIENWYDPQDGNQSATDLRYTYIEKVIRAENPAAEDIPYIAGQASAGVQANLGRKGYDPFIFEVQGLLIKHGYRVKHDGFSGTHTTDAIKSFQQKHRLKVTGVADQQTLAKLRGR